MLQAKSSESPTTTRRRRRSIVSRQMTLPCNLSASMSYLQVPGQEARGGSPSRMSPLERRLRLPSGGIDEQNGRRRIGHQSSIESYYSFASEGDGDIFASSENLMGRGERGSRVQRQTSFCIPDSNISEYSEFNEDCQSSISDLFRRGRLENQGTFSEQGSIRSLSIDQEEITFELPGMREEEEVATPTQEPNARCDNPNYLSVPTCREFSGSGEPEEDYEGYISSSCSISMSSDLESSHQITVPVFIEPAPPEIRFYVGPSLGTVPGLGSEYWRQDSRGHEAGGQRQLQHQETMHTDSGLDTEEICPATPTGGRFMSPASPALASKLPLDSVALAGQGSMGTQDNLRMVLVRDIGIQCCAESPNLSLGRRSKSADNSGVTREGLGLEGPGRPTSLCSAAGKFQSELLF